MAKSVLSFEDVTDKSVGFLSEILNKPEDTAVTAAMVLAMAVVTLYKSGVLFDLGVYIAERVDQHPIKSLQEYMNDYSNTGTND